MHISWLGGTTIKIQAKPFDEEMGIVIDPYRPDHGSFPRSLTPHMALFSRGEAGSIPLSGNPFILATPGECETKGILMTAAPGENNEKIYLRLDAEGMSVGHLGLTNRPPNDAQLEILSDIDILLLPVGGGGAYEADTAVKVLSAIEPRIVIPIAYQSDNDPQADRVDAFLKAFGGSPRLEKKLIVKKKDLPTEETIVVVLSKE